MIEDIYLLGKVYSEIENIEPDFIQNPNVDKIVVIQFKEKNKRIVYKEILVMDFDKDNWKKYMYRRKSSNGPDFTFTAKITNIETTFINKIIKWFEDKENLEIVKKNKLLWKLMDEILTKKRRIIKELIEKTNELKNEKDKKEKYILTVMVDNNYVKDILTYDFFICGVKNRFFKNSGEGKCIICGKKKKVGGKFSVSMLGFEFCTFDKLGFAPSFNQEEGWKEIPICFDCGKYIDKGKGFLDEFLNQNSGLGFSYYYIPSFILKKRNAIEKVLKKIISISYRLNYENFKGLIKKEDKLYDIIKTEGDWFKLNFLFYVKPTAQKFLILNYINDIRPSWLNRIYKEDNEIIKEWIFKEDQMKKIIGKNWEGSFISPYFKTKEKGYISWWILWLKNIFSSNKEYIQFLSDILSNRKINFSKFIHFLNLYLQNNFKNNSKELKFSILRTLAIYLFIKKLNLFKGDTMKKENLIESNEIFEKYKDIFSNNERRIAFLIGVLANYVIYVQWEYRGKKKGEFENMPFRKKFNNLLIDQKKLQKIFINCVEKLVQYDKSIPRWFPENLKDCLNTSEKWKSSVDEISYFFTLGLVLGTLFIKYKNNNEVNENEE